MPPVLKPGESGWTGWRDGLDYETHFRVVLTERDSHTMSHRQIEDFYRGIALVAAAFEPDERFDGVAETPEERVASVRFDERLRDFIDRLDRP